MPILKLSKPDPDREIEFELNYLKSLKLKERFKMMFEKSKQMSNLLKKHEYRKSSQIIKRT